MQRASKVASLPVVEGSPVKGAGGDEQDVEGDVRMSGADDDEESVGTVG